MLVVPEEEGALDDLEVVRVEAAGEVREKGGGDLTELVGAEELKDLFELGGTRGREGGRGGWCVGEVGVLEYVPRFVLCACFHSPT